MIMSTPQPPAPLYPPVVSKRRPHNSGHYTYEACDCDQFENHVRAVLGLPLGGTSLRVGSSMMLNVLGDPGGSMEATTAVLAKALPVPGEEVEEEGRGGRRGCTHVMDGRSRMGGEGGGGGRGPSHFFFRPCVSD